MRAFRHRLYPIAKNVFHRQNLLELVFQDISRQCTKNYVVYLLLGEPDIGKKDVANAVIIKTSSTINIDIQRRLNTLKENPISFNLNNNNNNLPPRPPPSPLPSPPKQDSFSFNLLFTTTSNS